MVVISLLEGIPIIVLLTKLWHNDLLLCILALIIVDKTSLKDDFYHYVEESYELVGEVTGKRYKLGQTVEVTVIGTDELMRTIDFELAGT